MESDPTDNSATSINDLPNELLTLIFENLKIKDLIRCTFVCKRFKSICSCVKIPELIIRKRIENVKDYWYYTHRQFNYQDAIDAPTFLSNRSMFGLDKLKRLLYEGSHSDLTRLNVNDFTQLDQLKIYIEYEEGVQYELEIDLPNLKVIEICSGFSTNGLFFLSTPKLKVLKCINFDCIKLSYPDTIEHLETVVYSESTHELKNLRHFDAQSWFVRKRINRKILSLFPKLRTLECCFNSYGNTTVIQNLYSLVEQKFNLQRPELKIYFNSVELKGFKKIDEYQHTANVFEFQIDNFDLLSNTISDRYVINYNELMSLVEGNIPDDFYKKYFNTKTVRVTRRVKNHEHFYRFIKNFDYLTDLRLESDKLDHSFYDGLTDLNLSAKINIERCAATISNYDFLLKLKNLESFSTKLDSSKFFDLALALFRHSESFELINFFYKQQLVRIGKSIGPSEYFYSRCVRNCDVEDRANNIDLDFDGLARLVDKVSLSELGSVKQN